MPIIFDRNVAVQLGEQLFKGSKDGGLRIGFDVTKTLSSAPLNKASLQIFNVSEDTYEQVAEKRRDLVVQIFAGYGGAANRVFIGNPVKNGVEFQWSDADRVLKLTLQDGYKAYKTGRMRLTLDADKVTLTDVVAQAAASLNIPLGVIDIPVERELTQGLTINDSAANVLDRITRATGAQWSIQDGSLQILPNRTARRNSGPLYSTELGNIVNFPTLTEEGLKLQVFLDSGITPGDRFKVVTGNKRTDGVWRATTVKHTGDLWDNPFYTELEATRWTGETAKARGKAEVKSGSDFYKQFLPDGVDKDKTYWQ